MKDMISITVMEITAQLTSGFHCLLLLQSKTAKKLSEWRKLPMQRKNQKRQVCLHYFCVRVCNVSCEEFHPETGSI